MEVQCDTGQEGKSRACVLFFLLLNHGNQPWPPEVSYKHITFCKLNISAIYMFCVSCTELKNNKDIIHSDVIWRSPDGLSCVNLKKDYLAVNFNHLGMAFL
jgi:hypothetical protein